MTEVTEALKEYQEARKELADAAAAYRHMAEKPPQTANSGEGQPLEGGGSFPGGDSRYGLPNQSRVSATAPDNLGA